MIPTLGQDREQLGIPPSASGRVPVLIRSDVIGTLLTCQCSPMLSKKLSDSRASRETACDFLTTEQIC